MAGLKRWNGSAWVDAALKRYNGGSQVSAVGKYWNGSAWVQFYPITSLNLTGGSYSRPPRAAPITGKIRINDNGTVEVYNDAPYTVVNNPPDWIEPKSAAGDQNYYVRATKNFLSDDPTTGAVGTWRLINGNDPEWTIVLNDISGATANLDLKLEISDRNDGTNILATADYDFSYEVL